MSPIRIVLGFPGLSRASTYPVRWRVEPRHPRDTSGLLVRSGEGFFRRRREPERQTIRQSYGYVVCQWQIRAESGPTRRVRSEGEPRHDTPPSRSVGCWRAFGRHERIAFPGGWQGGSVQNSGRQPAQLPCPFARWNPLWRLPNRARFPLGRSSKALRGGKQSGSMSERYSAFKKWNRSGTEKIFSVNYWQVFEAPNGD